MFNVLIRKKKYLQQPYIFLFIYSFFLMLFFTQASPFYTMSEWVDSQAFFTVGKGMANGLVPYRDLFEQKGPLLYWFHAVAYTISHKNFLGVYILESLAMLINLLLAFRISKLYLNWMPSVIISIFFPILLLNQNTFAFGDSAEEFSIPFLLAFLFILLRHFRLHPESSFKWKFYLMNGVLIGCVFWIKYTLIGAWIGFYLAILFIFLIEKKWRELGGAIVYTFIGLLLSSVPWIFYFGIHHAVKDLIDVYIKFNLFTYSSQTSTSGKLINAALIFGRAFNANFESKILIIIGMIGFLFTWTYLQYKNQKWLFFSSIVFLIVGVYFGGREYPYYFLIITPLGLFGMISVGGLIERSINFENSIYIKSKWFMLSVISLTAIFLLFGYNSNMKYSKLYNKDLLPQQIFAQIMHKEPHPTLLNYGSLDGGFYLAADIVPNVRYFESQNIDHNLYPENMDEQNRYIKEGMVQFIVVRLIGSPPPDQVTIPNLYDHYVLVSQQDRVLEGTTFRYLLFKKVK